VWETVVVSITLIIMFGIMLSDKIGPDWVMFSGLLLFIATGIVTIKEALVGFSNEGIMTVMVLFVVAEGISRTGALDYYLGKLLGRPTTIPGAQIRLMIPIAILSAFLNNTPIVAVMIPFTLRWAKTIGIPKEQLLIPLSYATILGGTLTLVGTSTNLVISGMLAKAFPDEAVGKIGLFYIAIWGVPNAILGISYMVLCGSYILPKGRNRSNDIDDLLLGARIKPWSPAAGRTYKRSALRDVGGIFLVNVRRAATGNIHHNISEDFVFSVGDELYFTGAVEKFSEFCTQHGLEIITTDNHLASASDNDNEQDALVTRHEVNNEVEKIQLINRLSDKIQGREPVDFGSRPSDVVVTRSEADKIVLVGVDTHDRPGLLVDISTAISQHGLNVRHSEAKVFGDRSLSVWRCEDSTNKVDLDVLWSAVTFLLLSSEVSMGPKKRVIRTVITKSSGLIGKKPIDVDFSTAYNASIVAYQKDGKNVTMDAELGAGDLLVLEVSEGSPLLTKPPTSSSVTVDDDIEGSTGSSQVWKDLELVVKHRGDGQTPKGEYLTAFFIPKDSPLKNKSLTELGYTNLPGVVLISIERPSSGNANTYLTPDDALQVGDIFWYLGSAADIADLQKVHGLVFYQGEQTNKAHVALHERRLVQAVVAKGSPLIGHTVTDVHFRSEYGGIVIAIQRGSNRIHDIPSNVKLLAGDSLLIEAGSTFVKNHEHNYSTFALVKEVENSSPPRPRMFWLCVILIAASLAIASVELQSLMTTAGIVGVIMVAVGVVTQQEARNCLQWDLYVTVASAFGIASAMTNSGVADGVATGLVSAGLALGIGNAGVYGSVYFAGNLLSAILTNNAAATLMFPIAMNAVDQTGCDRLKMAVILMLSASDYITSFGYQCNLMVYGPGEYANMDYLKFGAPMQVILWISSTAFVSLFSSDNLKWLISWVACSLVFLVIAVIRLTPWPLWRRKEKSDQSASMKRSLSWQFHVSA
jgi:di/tricarboxylate transporter/predicted amino acid-binding ACT domain protein